MKLLHRLLRFFRPTPNPQLVAKQLRQPSGALGRKVGEKMNESNEGLYDFALREMKLRDGDRVLEIGFGNGKFFEKLFTAAAHLKLAGLDFSKEMMKAAAKRNRQRLASGDLEMQFGSSDAMPFTDASFDKVFCINVIYFWEKPLEHLREIRRVLKPGGRFFSIIRTKEAMEHLPFTQYGFLMYTAEAWEAILKEAGFGDVKITTQEEAPFEIHGKQFPLESLCFTAW